MTVTSELEESLVSELYAAYSERRRPDFGQADHATLAGTIDGILNSGHLGAGEHAVRHLRIALPALAYARNMSGVFDRMPPAAEPLSEFNDDTDKDVQIVARNSETVVLLFCGAALRLGLPLPIVHRWLTSLPASLVYLRDFNRGVARSYVHGVKSLGPSRNASVASFRSIIASLNGKRVLCIGESSGSFAALDYGLELGAEAVLCMAGATNLSVEFNSHSRRETVALNIHAELPDARLDMQRAYSEAARPPRVRIVYGENHWTDRIDAQHMASLPCVTFCRLDGFAGHHVVIEAIKRGLFEGLLDWLVGQPAGSSLFRHGARSERQPHQPPPPRQVARPRASRWASGHAGAGRPRLRFQEFSSLSIGALPNEKAKTVCVLGLDRGCTSTMAGVLESMGVFMGRLPTRVDTITDTDDDPDFIAHAGDRDLFLSGDRFGDREEFTARARNIVRERNRAHPVWGWKDPLAILYLKDLDSELRNPHYIFIARDLIAAAQRQLATDPIPVKDNFLTQIDTFIDRYRRLVDFLAPRNRPILYVSYERALSNPQMLIKGVCDFLGRPLPDAYLMRRTLQHLEYDRTIVPSHEHDPTAWRPDIAVPAKLGMAAHEIPGPLPTDLLNLERDRINSALLLPDINGTDVLTFGMETCIRHQYGLAAGHVNGARYGEAENAAMAVLRCISLNVPAFALGPWKAGAELRYGNQQMLDNEWVDFAVGCINIIGLSRFNRGLFQEAEMYFGVGYGIAVARIQRQADKSPISNDLIWSLAFHEGLSAHRLGKHEVSAARLAMLQQARSGYSELKLSPSSFDSLALFADRAHAEFV